MAVRRGRVDVAFPLTTMEYIAVSQRGGVGVPLPGSSCGAVQCGGGVCVCSPQ